ncbi:HEAT repeat domain-containing protein [Tolypothrix sp. VBCCA 56010]|uniref:HEAT repeat domain-containing protein n=1 Tax=Tolypothrix sp. VBCCA 56010 TaxID=3137731 RepID=UPI003D7E336D
MSRNIRWDELTLKNVLSLVEALLQLSEQQDCESKLPFCVVWNADKLRITGYKSEQIRGKRSKTNEVGTKQEYLLNQIKNAGKSLKLPHLKAESSLSPKERELQELQAALDCLKELGVREDERANKNQGYWKFILTLKHQTATREENLEVVKQKWKQHPKTNSSTVSQTQTADKSFDWQEICGTMLEKHKRLTTDQLLCDNEHMKFEVNQIHVPLALVQRTKTEKKQDTKPEQGSQLYKPSYEEKPLTKTDNRNQDTKPQQDSRLDEPSYEEKQQRFEHQDFLEKIIRDGDGKTKGHRIALIGEPGAGKTTQLQTIAFWILENKLGLPIWISLADLQTKSVKDYLLQNWLEDSLQPVEDVKEEEKKAFADLFKNNSVWLLLDAADEMSSPEPLTKISEQLTGWVKNARVVLTCRMNVWQADGGALADFETYRLLDFDYPQQVQEFIQKWFESRNLTPQPPLLVKERGSENKERGSENKGEELWTQLNQPERQRIKDLVKNPLRLALLCSTWQSSDGGLPEMKAGLYQQFVQEFYNWKKKRFRTTPKQRQTLNAALGGLSKKAIDGETSRFRLRYEFVSNELGDPEEEGSLFWLALKLGWLNEVGIAAESTTKQRVYAFYHPTFEEYFAALAVDDWDFFLPRAHDNNNPQPVAERYRIFEPQWKEVILLWLGREDVENQEKEEFIQALVKFKDGCGEFSAIEKVKRGFYEFRAYFLAAAGIAEFKDYTKADAIVADIMKWGFGEFEVEQNEQVSFMKWGFGNELISFLYPIAEGARTALTQTNRIKAIDALVKFIDDNPKYLPYGGFTTDSAAAEILGKIDPSNEKAIMVNDKPKLDDDDYGIPTFPLPKYSLEIDNLLSQLDYNDAVESIYNVVKLIKYNELIVNFDVFDSNPSEAEESLEEIGSGNDEKTIDFLVELIRKPKLDDYTRSKAAEILGKIGSDNQKAIDALVELIRNPELYNFTRILAAYSLGKIDPGNQEAINFLVELIDNPELYNFTRILAAYSLGKIDPGNQEAINFLVELIRNSQWNDSTGSNAAEILGKIDSSNENAIDALVKLIDNPELDNSSRILAAYSLEKIDPGKEKAIATLVELICKPELDNSTRSKAVESLGKISSGNEKAIDALVELIDNPEQHYYFGFKEAVVILGKIGSDKQKAINALVKLIDNPPLHYYAFREAAKSLEEIGSGNENAIDALVKLIRNPQLHCDTLRQALYCLRKIGSGNQNAINGLVELIDNSKLHYFALSEAAYCLGEIGSGNEKANEKVIDALVKLIRNPQLHYDTRRAAAESLGEIGSGNKNAINALVELIANPQLHYDTRRHPVKSLGKILSEEQMPSVVTGLKNCLSDATYENDFERFDNCYSLIWNCAQSMPYPAFYQAWHQQEKVKDGE